MTALEVPSAALEVFESGLGAWRLPRPENVVKHASRGLLRRLWSMLDGGVHPLASRFSGAFFHSLLDLGRLVPNYEHNGHEHHCHRESTGEVFHEVSPEREGLVISLLVVGCLGVRGTRARDRLQNVRAE